MNERGSQTGGHYPRSIGGGEKIEKIPHMPERIINEGAKPILLTSNEFELIQGESQDNPEVQNLLKQNNMLIGEGYVYKIKVNNFEVLLSTDPGDFGTLIK